MVITIEDTPNMALAYLLGSRLRFGDERQISALEVLRLAEDLIGEHHKCPECDEYGNVERRPGHCDCCGRECEYCGGSRVCKRCNGSGYLEWSRDQVYALRGTRIWELIEEQRERTVA